MRNNADRNINTTHKRKAGPECADVQGAAKNYVFPATF